jgi:hypothetical protein
MKTNTNHFPIHIIQKYYQWCSSNIWTKLKYIPHTSVSIRTTMILSSVVLLIFGIEHNYSDSFQYAKTLVDDGSYTI